MEGMSELTQLAIIDTFTNLGWEVSEQGEITCARMLNRFPHTLATMRYATSPLLALTRGHGEMPLTVSRVTPEIQNQTHLERPITVQGKTSPTTLGLFIEEFLQSHGITTQLEICSIPMIDCLVAMPLSPQGKTYFAGSVQVGIRDGAAIIIDKGHWDKSIWVTESDLIGLKDKSLPIAPVSDGQEIQVFSVTGALPSKELTAELVWANSITVLILVSPPRRLVLPSSSSEGYSKTFSMQPATMGDNVGTGFYAEEGKLSNSLNTPLILNIFPFITARQIDASDVIHRLAENV
jgi:hypothetical protein